MSSVVIIIVIRYYYYYYYYTSGIISHMNHLYFICPFVGYHGVLIINFACFSSCFFFVPT